MKAMSNIKRIFGSIALTTGLLAAPLAAVAPAYAAASKPVNFCLRAKDMTTGGSYTDCSAYPGDVKTIQLAMGDKIRLQMRMGIDREVVNTLRMRVYFPTTEDPIGIWAYAQADSQEWQAAGLNFALPANSFVKYTPSTTYWEIYNRATGQYEDTQIADVSGRSALWGNDFASLFSRNQVGKSTEWTWTFAYADLEVVSGDQAPYQRPAPKMEMESWVANLTAGGSIWNKATSANIAKGETVRVAFKVHNGQFESQAQGTKLAVSNLTSGRLTGSNFAAVAASSQINITDGSQIAYVPGSARLFGYGDTAGRALSAAEVEALFNGGLALGNSGRFNGCWVYQQWVMFDVVASKKGEVQGATTLPATGPENVIATSLFLGYLGVLVRKLKIR
jgi:hypothetical protein